jgi:DNA invertase Pin-like site-specific DNA recombinase
MVRPRFDATIPGPEASIGLRAAQYVRMSTDYQKYSTQSQKEAIAGYAAVRNIDVVRTYQDDGRSGLHLQSRQAMKALICDVLAGNADFDVILVYDVSRWGRFQDADEGAHYEFICKEAGVRVEYCAEEFLNDGSLLSTMMKYQKRAMAAEYSRDLSTKVFAAQCRLVTLGFRQGGHPGIGLRRLLIDEHGKPKCLLKRGDRKCLQSDRVILRPGPLREIKFVRSIFHQFVVKRKSQSEIVRELNENGVLNHFGRPWTTCSIRTLLENENYIGNNIYNRKTFRLRQKQRSNSPNQWVRAAGAFEEIVKPAIFARAQEIRRNLNREHLFLSNRDMLARLASLFQEKGHITRQIIDEADALPHSSTYILRFGSLKNAYKQIEYHPKGVFNYKDGDNSLSVTIERLAFDLIARVESHGGIADFDKKTDVVTINGKTAIWICLARRRYATGRGLLWTVGRPFNLHCDLIVALRTDASRRQIIDFLLIPMSNFPKEKMEFADRNWARLDGSRLDTVHSLFHSIWSVRNDVSLLATARKGRPIKRKLDATATLLRPAKRT